MKYYREKLINKYIGLAEDIAKRKYHKLIKYNVKYDDILSECYYSLILTIDNIIKNNREENSTYIHTSIKYRLSIVFGKYLNTIKYEYPYGQLKENDLINNYWQEEVENKIQNEILLEKINKLLTPRENSIISLRFGLVDGNPRSQYEVARYLCVPVTVVSRLERKALMTLRNKLKYFK